MGARAFSSALKNLFGARENVAGKYTSLTLDDAAIARGAYKDHLGGGSEAWEGRGLFQLHLLRSRGLESASTLLDIGCGPLRAGVHFIRYLDTGNYFGFDYNTSFVTAARQAVEDHHLADKKPSIVALADFDFGSVNRRFDYAIAFSVLNHCNDAQRKLFFANIGRCLMPEAKLFISHARWLTEADLAPARLAVLKRFEPADLDLGRFGWPIPEQRSVCPIFELGKLPD